MIQYLKYITCLRPIREPINGATVDERRKHAQTRPKCVPYRSKAQNDVQIGSDSVHEEIIKRQRVGVNFPSGFFSSALHLLHDFSFFFRLEQIWDVGSVEDNVHVFCKRLVLDLIVSQIEDGGLPIVSRMFQDSLQILSPFIRPVCPCEFNLT